MCLSLIHLIHLIHLIDVIDVIVQCAFGGIWYRTLTSRSISHSSSR